MTDITEDFTIDITYNGTTDSNENATERQKYIISVFEYANDDYTATWYQAETTVGDEVVPAGGWHVEKN